MVELSRLRRMMLVAQGVVERGYEAGANVQAFLDGAQQDVFGAAAGVGVETLKEIKEPVLRALDNLEAVQKRVMAGLSPITGVPTGIATLDKNTLGLQPGSLCVLAARPSVGKTAFALNIATHAATRAGKRVAFFSLEMPSEQLALRMLASEAKLDWRRLSQGQLSSYDWQKIQTHGDRIARASVWLDDNFVLTPMELRESLMKKLVEFVPSPEIEAWWWCKPKAIFRVGIEDNRRAFDPSIYKGKDYVTVFEAGLVANPNVITCP